MYFNRINNRKETKGRLVRKQYAPKYSEKELEAAKKSGISSIRLLQMSREKKMIIHENR